jgi:iron complex outermembrane receptor protein
MLTGVSTTAFAQAEPAPAALDAIVVTATRSAARAFDVPASVDIIEGSVIRDGQPMINLSETLPRVPGMFAANRQNYAQDLQISSRGFGARATFGVRGVRLYQDGIPRRCRTGGAAEAASACFRRSGSKCCAGRSPRCTAMRRVG